MREREKEIAMREMGRERKNMRERGKRIIYKRKKEYE